jgi:hypothetical protein
MDLGSLIKWKTKREARERHKAILDALSASQGILAAALPVFHLDHSKLVTEFRQDISKAVARFRRASRHGGTKLPSSLTLSPASFEAPRKVPVLPSPTPVPSPSPAPTGTPAGGKVASTLTLDTCPVNTPSPKPIEVGGTLTPAQAGSQIAVTFSHPGLPDSVVESTTDSSGKWTASDTPDPTQSGTWTVTAAFAGDASRLPSSSQTCKTTYG